MKTFHKFSAILCGMCITTLSMAAAELMIFPNADQTGEQQEADKFACYGWAKNESGFDPMAPPTTTSAPPQQQAQKGGAAKGMLRGAAIGGIVDGSSGAKKGAGAGAVLGSARRKDQQKAPSPKTHLLPQPTARDDNALPRSQRRDLLDERLEEQRKACVVQLTSATRGTDVGDHAVLCTAAESVSVMQVQE